VIFFKPLDFHLELADLLEKFRLQLPPRFLLLRPATGKKLGSCSIKWFRHSRIWLGWTLNSLAIWAIVFSPLAASNATLALNTASYVFLILVSLPYLKRRYGIMIG